MESAACGELLTRAAATTLTATARVACPPTNSARDPKSGDPLSVAQMEPSSRRQRIVLLPQSIVRSCCVATTATNQTYCFSLGAW